MKKLFPFMLILFLGAGLFGLPAIPLRPGSDAPGPVVLREDIPDTALKAPAGGPVNDRLPYLSGNETAVILDVGLICLWSEQYRDGLLNADEFKTLVSGRIAVMYMRWKVIEDVRRTDGAAVAGYPLLC